MLLKRLYSHDGPYPSVRGIKVLRAGERQHFSPRLVEGGVAEGWLSMAEGKIVIHGEDGRVVYRIERTPGFYCCHCGRKLDDSPGAKTHVEKTHGQLGPDGSVVSMPPSPNPENPSGYERINYYDCVKDEGVVRRIFGGRS